MSVETSTFTLSSGHPMPVIGLGSFDGFSHTPEELAAFKNSIKVALESGYRSVDCAEVYGNEDALGEGLEEFLKTNQAGITRKDLFITSKLFVFHHSKEGVREAVTGSLKKLRLDYLDLYLIHWPAPQKKVDGKDVAAEIPLIETWRALEELVAEGKVKSIGVSNFETRHLEEILSQCKIKPAVNQVECNPFLSQRKLLAYCKEKGIVLEAYSPLGKAGATKYHVKSDVLGNPELVRIAQKHNVTPAQVALKWQIQRGVVVIPKSVTPERIRANIQIGQLVLDQEDVAAIDALHTGFRLVSPPFMKFEEDA